MTWDAAAISEPVAMNTREAVMAKPAWLTWEGMKKMIVERPLTFAVLVTGCKTCAADVLTQKAWEKKKEIDWRRNAVFTLFGLGYLGAFQYVLYSRWFPVWFPGFGIKSAASCVLFDQTVNTGMFYYPRFYVLQDAVMNAKVEADTFKRGSERYFQNVAADMWNCWRVWVPMQMINFSVMPIHLRAPYGAFVSFGWTCILSSLRGDITK